MRQLTDNLAFHEFWTGSNLKKKRKCVGLRIGTNNFQRKLYASEENIIETVVKCAPQ